MPDAAAMGAYGGDPNRIVLWGQSAGAGLVAGYLSHHEFHAADGPGVKAAILLSGSYDNGQGSPYFGNDPQELRERSSVQGMTNINIPLFVSHTEVDLPNAIKQAETLKSALCNAGRCPAYAVFKDHSHMSQVFSVGVLDSQSDAPRGGSSAGIMCPERTEQCWGRFAPLPPFASA